MRKTIFIGALVVSSCSSPHNTEWLPNENPTLFQVFTIDADKDTTLVGSEGTILSLRANSFQSNNGETVEGKVEVRFKEFYHKSDFIKNRLSTTTVDGKLLQSSGMLLIEAWSDTSSLRLRNDQPATLMFPRLVESDVANLFSGQNGPNDEIRWSQLESIHIDTLVIEKKTITGTGFGGESVTVDFQFVIGSDTIDYEPGNGSEFTKVLSRSYGRGDMTESTLSTNKSYFEDDRAFYPYFVFQTSKLGFINCDIFVNMELHDLTVKLDNGESDVFIVIDSLNSVLYPEIRGEHAKDYVFSIPRNLDINIVAYRKDNDGNHYLGVNRARSSMSEIALKQIKKSLQEINIDIERISESSR